MLRVLSDDPGPSLMSTLEQAITDLNRYQQVDSMDSSVAGAASGSEQRIYILILDMLRLELFALEDWKLLSAPVVDKSICFKSLTEGFVRYKGDEVDEDEDGGDGPFTDHPDAPNNEQGYQNDSLLTSLFGTIMAQLDQIFGLQGEYHQEQGDQAPPAVDLGSDMNDDSLSSLEKLDSLVQEDDDDMPSQDPRYRLWTGSLARGALSRPLPVHRQSNGGLRDYRCFAPA
ncbi:hypothetical protein BGX31_008577 [Mortierella sp. GBA43]|nr:hypothetical protein BGX31_008577 [Mortierella sp. GBA43]